MEFLIISAFFSIKWNRKRRKRFHSGGISCHIESAGPRKLCALQQMRPEETSPHFLYREIVYLKCLHRQLPSLKHTHRVLQSSLVFKACWVSGTPTEKYRLGWVSMAENWVCEQELTYLPSSYSNKSQPILIRQLSMLLQKLRPDYWLLPFRGRHDSQ